MARKVFAVTNVKIGNGEGEFFASGAEINVEKFTRHQLVELHEAGAVEVRVVDDESPDPVEVSQEKTEETSVESAPENEVE